MEYNVRQIREDDYKTIFSWIESEGIDIYPLPASKSSEYDILKEFESYFSKNYFYIIEIVPDNKRVGFCHIDRYDVVGQNVNTYFYVEPNYDMKEIIQHIIKHFFFNLNVNRISFFIFEFEKSKITALQNLQTIGVTKTGVFPEDIYRHGKYYDKYIYSVLCREYSTKNI